MASLYIIYSFILAAVALVQCSAELSLNGSHVCEKNISYQVPHTEWFTRVVSEKYKTCCKKIIGICVSKCEKTRSKLERYSVIKMTVKTKMVSVCCPGFEQSGNKCKDINECKNNNGGCNQVCNNKQGSFKCVCRAGFRLLSDGKTCVDINECEEQKICDSKHGICTNTEGGFHCSCKSGFEMKNDFYCKDINECKINNGGCDQECKNEQGSFKCACKAGFRLLSDGKTCADINECEEKNLCDRKHGICTNTEGGFHCSCKSGYKMKKNFKCEDINECGINNGGCDQECKNEQGSFKCACKAGFRLLSNGKTCADVNECEEQNPCDRKLGLCTNTEGGFQCSCKSGYKLRKNLKCEDIDECTEDKNECDQLCQNTIGSYKCFCKLGFHLNEDGKTCEDTNECAKNNGGCSQECINEKGSFKCACKDGFRLSSDGKSCTDIDECKEQKPCDSTHGVCTNVDGGFDCSCSSGFEIKENNKCVDINECLFNNGGCSQNCENLDGSFKCTCRSGYHMREDGKSCDDINECLERNSCDKRHGICTNLPGSYQCSCQKGFRISDEIDNLCEDIDECADGTNQCAQVCHNIIGSYKCSCKPGFHLKKDQKSCKEFKCPVKLEAIGCYNENAKKRAFPIQLLNERKSASSDHIIDWTNFDKYLPEFACRCAMKALSEGYSIVGLQNLAECWSGPEAHLTYDKHFEADTCITNTLVKSKSNKAACPLEVGLDLTNYVYRVAPAGCDTYYEPIGCFKDNQDDPRPVPHLIATERNFASPVFDEHLIDWQHWNKFLPQMVCRCAALAKEKGHEIFALQFWGQCWSGNRKDTDFARDGVSTECRGKNFKPCGCNSRECVGMAKANYVYELKDAAKLGL